ncbi:MAG: hypothetical protein AAF721_00550 [Myxococcota bacterium]
MRVRTLRSTALRRSPSEEFCKPDPASISGCSGRHHRSAHSTPRPRCSRWPKMGQSSFSLTEHPSRVTNAGVLVPDLLLALSFGFGPPPNTGLAEHCESAASLAGPGLRQPLTDTADWIREHRQPPDAEQLLTDLDAKRSAYLAAKRKAASAEKPKNGAYEKSEEAERAKNKAAREADEQADLVRAALKILDATVDHLGDRQAFDSLIAEIDEARESFAGGQHQKLADQLARFRVELLLEVATATGELARALSALSAPDEGGAGVGPRSLLRTYYSARSTRERADAALADARRDLEMLVSRCRFRLNIGAAPECVVPDNLKELLGRAEDGFDAAAIRSATNQLKAVGGGQVSKPASELLTLTTEIALKRAKRNGLAVLQARLERIVCNLNVPQEVVVGATESKPVFPATCTLLSNTSLEELATDPRQLQPALTADLVGFAAGSLAAVFPPGQQEVLQESLRLALKLVQQLRNKQEPRPAHIDAQALLSALGRLRCKDAVCANPWTGDAIAVPLALEAVSLYVTREGRVDVSTIVSEVINGGAVTERVRRLGVELALLGVRALGLSREPAPDDEHDAWWAAVELTLEVSALATVQPRAKEALALVKKVVESVADGNTPAAVSAGAALAVKLLPTVDAQECGSGNSRSDRAKRRAARKADKCRHRRDLDVASQLLSGVAAYSATYVAKTSEGKTDAELRAQRTEALEGVIDVATRRTYRHGDVVFGLGIPVGFGLGWQSIRTRRDRADDMDDVVNEDDPAQLTTPGFMPPQLEVPLGFGLQRLVGRRHRDGVGRDIPSRRKAKHGRWYFDGIHVFASLIDLGQFTSYKADGEVNQPRWDTIFSPGAQLGWAVGTPANMFIIASEVRYAPTLFAGTSELSVSNSQEPGGALRFGLSLAYYVSLFDFN